MNTSLGSLRYSSSGFFSSFGDNVALPITYRQFTSATMTRMLFHERNITKTAMKPIVTSHFASVLFADISGFTRASTSFTQDQLCKHINNYFTQILSIIDEHNGDVVKFCGDALMIIWPVDHNASASAQEATVQLATACGLHLLRESASWNPAPETALTITSAQVTLGLHCGVSAGLVHCMCVGDEERWEFVVSGDPIGRAGDACSEASNGELCMTADAYEYQSSVKGRRVGKNCYKIEQLSLKKGIAELDRVKAISSDYSVPVVEIADQFESPIALPVPPSPSKRRPRNLTINTFRGSVSTFQFTQPNSPASPSKPTPESSPVDPKCISLDDVSARNSSRFTFSEILLSNPDSPMTNGLAAGAKRMSSKSDSSADGSKSNNHQGRNLLESSPKNIRAKNFPPLSPLSEKAPVQNRKSLTSANAGSSVKSEEVNSELSEHDFFYSLNEARDFLLGFLKPGEAIPLYKYDGMDEVLRCFVHESARESVESGTTSLMGELRVVVTIFVEILGLNKDFRRGSIRRPQKVMRFMLACLKQFGGALRQYIVDDKGCVMIAGFGLPGYAHVDSCARAVETAVAFRRLLKASRLDCKIGISEGCVYCGLVGSSNRCEYSMMGASVNLAARMMGKCKAGQIIVDENIFTQTSETFKYSKLPKIKAKGYKMPIQVYCPTDRADINSKVPNLDIDDTHLRTGKVDAFIGRQADLDKFERSLDFFCSTDRSSCHWIKGKIGVGKSWFVGEICLMATRKVGIQNLFAVEAQPPQSYRANRHESVRQLIRQIFNIRSGDIFEKIEPNTSLHRRVEVPPRLASENSGFDLGADSGVTDNVFEYMQGGKSFAASFVSNTSDSSVEEVILNEKLKEDTNRAMMLLGIRPRFNSTPKFASPSPFLSPECKVESAETSILMWVQENVKKEDVLSVDSALQNVDESDRFQSSINVGNDLSSIESDRSNSSEQSFTGIEEQSMDINKRSINVRSVLRMLPLLNDFLNIKLPTNTDVSEMNIAEKGSALDALLIFIICRTIDKAKTILVVEHVEWCDPISLTIILKCLNRCETNLYFIGTSRSPNGFLQSGQSMVPKHTSQLSSLCESYHLEPFSFNEIASTLEAALTPVMSLSNPEIMSKHSLTIIMDRTDGSPLLVCCLCFEISKAIRRGLFVDIESLPCGRRDNLIDLLDLLSHSDQLVLKVAAVIGRSFTVEELCYLLAMLGLSACLVDLQDALGRMMETSFIEQKVETIKLKASLSYTSSKSGGDLHSNENEGRYFFTNNSVHENVYNLLMEEHRESAHTFLGSYMESMLATKTELFDRTVFHFVRSNNLSKKIEYLCKAAEVSRVSCRSRDVYFYFGQLVKLATGLHAPDLLVFCCTSDHVNNVASHDALNPRNTRLCRISSIRRTNQFPISVSCGRRWIDSIDIKKPLYSILEDITRENVCRWVGEMGLILFELGSLRMSANLIKLSLHGMGVSIPGAPEFLVSSRHKDSWLSKLTRVARKHRLDPKMLPDDLVALRLATSMLKLLAAIGLMHGVTSATAIVLSYLNDVTLKIGQLKLTRTHQPRHQSAIGFVDNIIESDNTIDDHAQAHHSELNRLQTLSFEQSLHRFVNPPDEIKEYSARFLPRKESFSEIEDVEVASGANVSTTASVDGDIKLKSLSAVAFTEKSVSSERNSSENNVKNRYLAVDKLFALAQEASALFSIGKFSIGISRLYDSIINFQRKDSADAIWRFLYLYKTWITFVRGNGRELSAMFAKVSKHMVLLEQNLLHKWILEFKSLFLLLNCPVGSAVTAVHNNIVMLKAIRRSDKPAACSSAVMALAFALDGRLVEAVAHAKYAVQKLSRHHAVTLIGPIFAFIAAYAAAMVMELYAAAMLNIFGQDDAEADWFADAQQRSQKALRRYEAAKECATMGLTHLRGVYKSSQPCIVTLYRALKIKFLACDAVLQNSVHKLPYSKMMSPIKTARFSEFVFGQAFLRLEKLNMTEIFNFKSKFGAGVIFDYSADEILSTFHLLGLNQISLQRFGFFRLIKDMSNALVDKIERSVSNMTTSEVDQMSPVLYSTAPTQFSGDTDRINRLIGQFQPVSFDKITSDIALKELILANHNETT